jgi:hypothetical protein
VRAELLCAHSARILSVRGRSSFSLEPASGEFWF